MVTQLTPLMEGASSGHADQDLEGTGRKGRVGQVLGGADVHRNWQPTSGA